MPVEPGAPGGGSRRRVAAATRTTKSGGAAPGRRWGSPPPPGWDSGSRPSTARTRQAPAKSSSGAKQPATPKPATRKTATRKPAERKAAENAPATKRASARRTAPNTRSPKKRRPNPAAPRPRRLRRWLLRVVLAGTGLAALALAALAWYVLAAPLPAEAPEAQTTFVYDANGEKLASFFNGENRESVPLSRVPAVMVQAVLAAEDRNFYKHGGVDPLGVLRAVYQDVRGGGSLQGGSTITQQYVKNAYVGRERTLLRKAKEAVVSLKIERQFTKDEILERYLNAIYFGRGAYGVQAAAQAYFREDVEDLTLPEASYLAGLIRSPETADATRAPEKAAARRRSVLVAMVRTGAITPAQQRAADAVPLSGKSGIVAARPGPGQAYEHTDVGTQYFVDYVRRSLIAKYGEDRVFGGGLRVKTTLDLRLQRAAYEAVSTTLDRKSDPDAALVALDRDGRVRAMVGGKDWTTSRVNLAVGRGFGGVGRQGGSIFKPFVLATVLREGFSAESAFLAPAEITIEGAGENGTDWIVGNDDDHSYPGKVNLVDAMAHSINTVFAQVVTEPEIGPERVAQMARDLGVTSPLESVNAIALGAVNVAPLEVADAFLTFANRGVRAEPLSLVEVRTAGGRVLQRGEPARRRVLDGADADVVTSALQQVVLRGTGTKAQIGKAVAGKTGTTQNYGDAWFVGYTPGRCCTTAVWMGYAEGQSIPMNKVHGRRVTGGSFPAQIFARFQSAATKGESAGKFAAVKRLDGDVLGGSRRGTASAAARKSTATTRVRRRDTVVAVERPAVTAVTGGSEVGADGEEVPAGEGQGTDPASPGDATEGGGSVPGGSGAPTPTASGGMAESSGPVQAVAAPTTATQATLAAPTPTAAPTPAAATPPMPPVTAPPQTFTTVLIPSAPVSASVPPGG